MNIIPSLERTALVSPTRIGILDALRQSAKGLLSSAQNWLIKATASHARIPDVGFKRISHVTGEQSKVMGAVRVHDLRGFMD